ncbi:MAG TPA: VTT domain-containing protein [Chroococcidiopsis sp.]
MKLNPTLKPLLVAILTLAVAYLVMALVLRAIGLESAQHFIRSTGVWAPIIFIVLCAASLIIAPLSGGSMFVVGGALFGKEPGFALGYVATILGCNLNFWISRKLGRKVALRFIGKRQLRAFDRFIARFQSHQSIGYMIVLMPLAQDMVSYAVGLTKIKYWQFLIALLVSALVIVAAYVYLGTSLLEALL